MPNQPIKRHLALQPLSRDHHHGLLFCWKIRSGVKRGIEVSRMQAHAVWFWNTHLVAHFAEEEGVVFPILGAENELIRQALAEHAELKKLFAQEEMDYEFLNYLQVALEKHIRFEERILFNQIQEVADPDQLAAVKQHIEAEEEELEWEDDYWNWKKVDTE
ncbi:hemerythrin domain-containing protein [Algoriphagus persicinus]|uniref:hemerythrin domain-containing protein n=1 Tax=Algoriphagus persicinus TaxID=3108754 RepID=UPI002B3FADCC|nr:hemerythrin domain-containing protein [Algoriphagus sp. E1-3-M2]MEB2785854.1 hemerythrin domain-containing protein [Algoriphagus sp. E1-3-M2]